MWKYKIMIEEKKTRGKVGVINIETRKLLTKPEIDRRAKAFFNSSEEINIEYKIEPIKKRTTKISGRIGKYPLKKAYTYKKGVYA